MKDKKNLSSEQARHEQWCSGVYREDPENSVANWHRAKKAWERRKRCNEYIMETFRWNPVGNQSHPVEPGLQPAASLATRPAMAVVEA
jgi:hypothetical protein